MALVLSLNLSSIREKTERKIGLFAVLVVFIGNLIHENLKIFSKLFLSEWLDIFGGYDLYSEILLLITIFLYRDNFKQEVINQTIRQAGSDDIFEN